MPWSGFVPTFSSIVKKSRKVDWSRAREGFVVGNRNSLNDFAIDHAPEGFVVIESERTSGDVLNSSLSYSAPAPACGGDSGAVSDG